MRRPDFTALLADIWRVIGYPYLGYLILLILTGVLEGLTLASVVPLLAAIGIGDTAGAQQGRLAGMAITVLRTLGIEPGIAAIVSFVLAALVASTTLFLAQAWLGTTLQTRYVYRWQQRLIEGVFRANWGFFQRQRPGDLINAIVTEVPRLGGAFYQVGLLITGVLHGAIYLTLAMLLSGATTAIVLVGGGILFLLTRPLIRRAFAIGTGISKESADLQATALEMVVSAKSLKATATEREAIRLLDGMANRLRGHLFANSFDIQIAKGIFDFGAAAMVAGILFVSHSLLKIDPAITLVVLAIFVRMMPKLTGLQQSLQSLSVSLPAVAVVRDMAAAAEAEAECAAAEPLTEPMASRPLAVSLRGVTVRYGERVALDGVDLDIAAGECVALVGPSGSGKSTLVDALLGLVPVQGGSVRLGGRPLTELPLASLRRRVGYMGQDTMLFNASVRRNVAWCQPTAGNDAIRNALELAAAGAFVDRLPHGIDTIIGNRGTLLSGGERQRIGLARALLGEPGLLILDEATSALDAATEASVTDALEALKGTATIIIVAHRLSSVRIADRICVLEQGCIVESGRWDELQQRDGRFKRLWDMQVGSTAQVEGGGDA